MISKQTLLPSDQFSLLAFASTSSGQLKGVHGSVTEKTKTIRNGGNAGGGVHKYFKSQSIDFTKIF